MSIPGQYKFILPNGSRAHTVLSNFPEKDIVAVKWSKIIILIHGFPDDNTTFNTLWPGLLEKYPTSKRVLLVAPLQRGYEQSSIASGPLDYTLRHLAEDIKNWIDMLTPDHDVPVHLVGHDWGAMAVYKAASLFPDLIKSAVTMAIPYLGNVNPLKIALFCPLQIYYSSYFITMHLASLYRSKFTSQDNYEYLDSLWRFWSPQWNFSADDIASTKHTLSQPNIIDSTSAYYRSYTSNLRKERFPVVDFDQVPTLILAGQLDGCMYHKMFDLMQPSSNAIAHKVPNVGHFMHREDPVQFTELIINWIERHS
jgi:epoxide hydrolase 4